MWERLLYEKRKDKILRGDFWKQLLVRILTFKGLREWSKKPLVEARGFFISPLPSGRRAKRHNPYVSSPDILYIVLGLSC
jgi:hypothetical protein